MKKFLFLTSIIISLSFVCSCSSPTGNSNNDNNSETETTSPSGENPETPTPSAEEPVINFVLSTDSTYYIVGENRYTKIENLNIPSEYKGLPVKEIDSFAFAWNNSIKTVSIPESIIKIEKKAFYSIDNLELVYFNAKDCELISGDSSSELGTFENSGKNVSNGVKFIIGNKAKKVPDNFLCADTWQSTTCEKTLIKEILFEENSVCEEIGNYSFSKQNLSNFDYPNTVVKLGKSAFENCKISSNKLVHNNLQYIGDLCFGESSFEEVELPESVAYLGYSIFYNNKTLKTIRIKCNADTESSLENMLSGRSPYRGAGTEAEGVDFIIGSKVKKITADVFSDYGVYPKSFTFEEGSQLETIGKRAFKKVSAVGNISFPNTLKRIEEYAFSECINFNTESFPSSLEFIGLNAFANCTALTCKKPIASDTLTIETNAFYGCTNMQE